MMSIPAPRPAALALDTLPDLLAVSRGLAAALAAGLVIGLERGWQERTGPDGSRVAGVRTLTLIALMGGVLASLVPMAGPLPLAAGLLGLAALTVASYRADIEARGGVSETSAVVALLAFAIGALAASGQAVAAMAAAVVTAVLLDLRSALHRWLAAMEHGELQAALQMGVLSIVVLPLLPDAGLGPYDALNPYRLWWAVVLLAGLSLASHVAMRVTGRDRGLLWTGLVGGIASSTSATITLARRVRLDPPLGEAGAAGALAAGAVMCVRLFAILFALDASLLRQAAGPLVACGAVLAGVAAVHWQRRDHGDQAADVPVPKPLDLGSVLGFGVFLALVSVAARASESWLGASGVYGLATLSGFVDVDPIVVSLAQLHAASGLAAPATIVALALAVGANMLTKMAMAAAIGGRRFGVHVALGYVLAAAAAVGVGRLAGLA
jgi:uncharacterized membrane protein (DUF4010 family)